MDNFADFLGSGGSLFGGQPEPNMTFDFNAFGSNPAAAMLGNMALPSLFGATGTMPGQFFPTQNFYDQVQAKDYWNARQRAMVDAGPADRETYVRMLRGASRMTGRPYGLEQERAARTLASGLSSVAPFAQQIMGPDLFDSLHGSRGSASVMAQFLHRGSLQSVDPVTGRTGMSGESAGAMARRIHGDFFGQGADLSQFKGLSAGRFGMLYDELQTRGAGAGSIGALSEAGQAEALSRDPSALLRSVERLRSDPTDRNRKALADAGLGGMSAQDQDKKLAGSSAAARQAVEAIKRSLPDELDTIKRDFDADRYTARIKNLSGVVAGMRDVFGDLGRPNAPMRELMEGLEKLTQGGLATQSHGALEQSVRTTQALSKMTGVGIQGMTALMARGAGLADQMGLERQFAVAGTQGAAAFGAAFGQAGNADTPHFQARSKEEMTALDQQLRMNAGRSGLANQLATTVRMVETLEQQGLKPGARAAALAKAVRDGKATFVDPATGQSASAFQSESDWRTLMVDSGFKQEDVMRFARQRDTNRGVTSRLGIGDLVRDHAQGDELVPWYAQAQRSGIRDLLDARGVAGPAAERAADAASRAAAEAARSGRYTDEKGDVVRFNRRDDAARNAALGGVMRRSLAASGVKGVTDQEAALLAEGGFAAFDQATRQNPDTKAYGTGLARLEANDPAVLERKRKIAEEAKITGAMRSSLAGLGQAGPLARISDLIQAPAKDLGTALASAFGGVDPADVRNRLAQAGSMTDAELAARGITDADRVKAMSEQLVKSARSFEGAKSETDPELRASMLKAAQADVEGLTAGGAKAGDRIREILEARGLKPGQLDAVLKSGVAGVGGFNGKDLDRLRALKLAQSKGLMKSAEDAGMAAGATTGLRETDAALEAFDRHGAASGRAGGQAEALRAAEAMAGRGGEVAGGLLADPASLKALGRGGVDLASGLHDKQLELAALAKKKGKSAAQLIADNDPDAKPLLKGIQDDLKEVRRRQAAKPNEIPGMGMSEVARGDALRGRLVDDDATQNRRAVDALADHTGGKALTDEQRVELAKKLGTGRDAEVARHQLGRQLDARRELDAMAGMEGWDFAKVRKAVAEGKGDEYARKLSAEERAKFTDLGKRAGSVLRAGDEGRDARDYTESLRDLEGKPAAAAAAAGGGAAPPGKISGTLKLEGLTKALIEAVMGTGGGAGSTPVATPP